MESPWNFMTCTSFSCLCQTAQCRHYVLGLSFGLFCSSLPPLPNLWTQYFDNRWTDFDANCHEWSVGQYEDWGHCSSRTRDLLRLSRQTLSLDTGILTGHSQLNRDLSIVCIINKQVSVKKGLKPQPDSYTHVVSLWSSSSRMVAGLWGHTLGEVCDDVTGHLQKILFVPFVCRISTESGEIQWEIHVWILIS